MKTTFSLVTLVVLAAILATSCSNPVGPSSDSPTISLSPDAAHLRPGESQIFTAEGGDSSTYYFRVFLNNDAYDVFKFLRLERISASQAKVTVIAIPRYEAQYASIRVETDDFSGDTSRIYFFK